ncbi:MAG: hypothetical protein EOP37_16745 [Rubrivivax sp.]|nr:MAG: hypothetical protein EOP37_16745 [Rubrivivax sp.]
MTGFTTSGETGKATNVANATQGMRAAVAATPGLTQFYVVPWALRTVRDGGVETTLVECRYFDERWDRVDRPPVSGDHGFFRLTQCAVPKRGEQPPAALDLTLMSAVAKTRKSPKSMKATKPLHALGNLSNSFIASGAPRATSLIVPVLPDTARDIVLVFRSPASGDRVDFLGATVDSAAHGKSI